MKRTWLVWILVGGVIVTVLIAFNYERGKETVPLSEIFPDKDAAAPEVEYEFFDTDEKGSVPMAAAPMKEVPAAPVTATPVPPTASATAPVKKTPSTTSKVARPPAVVAPPPVATSTTGKVFTIQVAAFKEKAKAQKAVQQAQQKGYSAYVDERSSSGNIWYQVCIGKFDSQGAAKELLNKVKQDYKDSFIKLLSGK